LEVALGHRLSIGVDHDADGLPLARGASGRDICGGSSEQLGEQWVLLAHGFVGHHGDLTVTWCRDESDDAAPLEKAEDAFARTLDHRLERRPFCHQADEGRPTDSFAMAEAIASHAPRVRPAHRRSQLACGSRATPAARPQIINKS
jgi:hypothetical protein